MLEDFANFIGRGTLRRDASDGSDHGSKLSRRDVFAEIRPRCFGGALFHQSAAKIICARFQASQGFFKPKLDPRDLNVGDVAIQENARERMNDQILVDRSTRSGASALKKPGIGMDESQGNKLGKSSSVLLNVAEQKEMPYPMFRKLGMAVHHSGCRRNAETMSGPDDFNPLADF